MEDKKRATTTEHQQETKNVSSKKPRQQREPLTATPTDAFVKHPYLFAPFLDRVSLNRIFSSNKEIHAASRTVTLPWPEKRFHVVGEAVHSVAFSPDGGLLASGYNDGNIRIWNRLNGQCTVLQGHASIVRSVSFSPDGKFLASGSDDRTIRLWKLADSSYMVFEGHTDCVMSVAFSPDGSTIASGSDDGSVRLWDVSEGRCTKTLRAIRMQGVWSAAWSPDGATIAVADRSGLIFLCDISNEQNTIRAPIFIDGHEGIVTTVAYSPDGRYLASGSFDRTVKLWNVTDLSCAKVFSGHTQCPSVRFSPSGNILASGSPDGSVRLWSVKAADASSCLRNLKGHHTRRVCSVAFSPDGQTLASGCYAGTVRLCENW
jgi:WD40 repeat protein